jgi:DNA invertase Pin-like site-specific DNA recombinase|tara:strand:- start:2986 stop:3654 length:669 start_codon:yes stop_codon:yes gene_type:complete
MKYVSYLRVSTDKQGLAGLGMEAQRKACFDLAAGDSIEIIAEFSEVESGAKRDRPELAAALELCRKEKATLLVAKLDRLGRTVAEIATLLESSVEIKVADMPYADRFNAHIVAAVAEQERLNISNRTKSALAALKAKGKKLGSKNMRQVSAKGRAVRTKAAMEASENVYPVIERIRSFGITTMRGIAAELTDRKIPTASGRPKWHPQMVKIIIDRMEGMESV